MKQLFFAGAIALAVSSCHSSERTNVMFFDENKQVVRLLFEDGFNRDTAGVLDRTVGAEYVDATGERGPGAFRQVIARLRGAFPDIHYTIDDVVAEGDAVAIRWHWTGTHDGPFRGVPPTHRRVTNTGNAIFHVRSGKIVAAALETDRLGFLQSVGILPDADAIFRSVAQEPGHAVTR